MKDKIRELARQVLATEPVEIDCEEFLSRVAALLERLSGGQEIPRELRDVSQHLEVCSECKEELEALLRAYGDDG